MEDTDIIELYFRRSEAAIAETSAKYGRYIKKIAYNILLDNEDTEECANDTYMKTWNAIPPQRPSVFKAFLGKIARNTALNLYEKYRALKRSGDRTAEALDELSGCVPDTNSSISKISEDKEIKECLDRFLTELSADNRKMFVRRYWYMNSVKEIAMAFGCSESRVKMSLKRTRDKLKSYLESEGISI